VGAATGAAAGGVVGSQAPGGGVGAALGAVGGALVGGLVGTGVEHAAGDTTAWEYIVRKPGGELVSVTQQDKEPLPIGQKVLVIAGSQARIVADYTTEPQEEATVPPPSLAGIPLDKHEDQPPAVAPAVTQTPLPPIAAAPTNPTPPPGAGATTASPAPPIATP
jgi:outer membrane lipoprotein SlyB